MQSELMTKPIALITGAAQGIGYACAKALQADGARIVIADINEQGLKEAANNLGNNTLAKVCDIGDHASILNMFDEIEQELGRVSILVNNAGIAMAGDFLETSPETFKRVLDVNLTGAFVALQRAAKAMIAHDIEGAVVNISSINAVVAVPAIAAYCASKGGLMQLTKASSLALAPYNIRVNAVGPGSVDTSMLAGINNNAQAMEKVFARTPLKRLGKPSEIADAVVFLASNKASYITGETLYIDGGRIGMNYTC